MSDDLVKRLDSLANDLVRCDFDEGQVMPIRQAASRIEALEKEGAAAATHVESVICMRTDFTGNPPYVGWKGLGLALTEALDERDRLSANLDVAREALEAAKGYLLNAKIDIQTGAKKQTAIDTLSGGLRAIDAALSRLSSKEGAGG